MDCLDGLPGIADQSVDLVVADPPYFLGMTHNGQKGSYQDLNIARPFYEALAREIRRILKQRGEFYIFCDWRSHAFFYPIFADTLPVRNTIVWAKKSGPGNFYTSTHEFILYGSMSNTVIKRGTNVWSEKGFNSGAKTTNGKKVHPTQKPVELIERIILDTIPDGGLLVDPFLGSGTSAVAAIRTGCQYIGFEISKAYFDVAVKRIQNSDKNSDNDCGK